jgi:hypothetical protein
MSSMFCLVLGRRHATVEQLDVLLAALDHLGELLELLVPLDDRAHVPFGPGHPHHPV